MSAIAFQSHCCLDRLFKAFFVLLWLALPIRCLAGPIDFESLNAPGNGTAGLDVRNQFAGEGILFQNAAALDYSQGIPISNFAHSGTKAIELCRGAEFCASALDIHFTTAQQSVKLWVGYSASLDSAQTVIMRAFDIIGNRVGNATAVLGPSTGVIPISTPLQIQMPHLGRIVRVTVSFLGAEAASPTMFNNSLAIDDVEFSTQGPPPPCPSTQPPGIGLISPLDGQIVVNNVFTVEANLVTQDPFATFQVSVLGSGGQTNTFGPVFVNSGHVIFGGITGLLFPGADTIVVTVKDCFGANERRVTITYRNDVKNTRILVIDEDNRPVPAAEVYANGALLGRTDFSGQLSAPPLGDGTLLVARKFVEESTTYRGHHSQGSFQDWKFRVYISNVAVENDGSLTMFPVKLEPDPLALQVVRVLRKNTLIGLHVVASIEWDASAAEFEGYKQKLIGASRFLYNATDGQVLFEQADIVDNGTFWEEADYRIYANHNLRENVDCPRDGFWDNSFWCNDSWIHVNINSPAPVYAHEFGHYGFDLGDEYSDDDASVKCTHRLDDVSSRFAAHGPAAACMMNDEGIATKLCSSRPENPHVHGTRQGDDSCWTTLANKFKDDNDNPRWILQSPESRHVVPGIINGTNPPIPAWAPVITIQNSSHPNLCAPVGVHFSFSDGTPAVGEEVWLHTNYGANILQGKTNQHGDITSTGVHLGDSIQDFVVQSSDCSPAALVRPETPGKAPALVLVAQKPQPPQKRTAPPLRRGEHVPPRPVILRPPKFHVRMAMTPGKPDRTAEVSVWAEDLQGKRIALKQAPALKIKHVGHTEELKAPLRPALKGNGYTVALAQLPLDVEISIQATATDPQGHTEKATERFEMSRPDPDKASEIYSADGQLALKLPPKTFARGARVSIGPPTILLPKLEDGEILASGPFRVASDQPDTLANPATIEFRLPRNDDSVEYDPKSFVILVYDSATAKWSRQAGVVHPSPLNIVAFKTQRLGTFALIARRP